MKPHLQLWYAQQPFSHLFFTALNTPLTFAYWLPVKMLEKHLWGNFFSLREASLNQEVTGISAGAHLHPSLWSSIRGREKLGIRHSKHCCCEQFLMATAWQGPKYPGPWAEPEKGWIRNKPYVPAARAQMFPHWKHPGEIQFHSLLPWPGSQVTKCTAHPIPTHHCPNPFTWASPLFPYGHRHFLQVGSALSFWWDYLISAETH